MQENGIAVLPFSVIVDDFKSMQPTHRMERFQKRLLEYLKEKYPKEKNDQKRIRCFNIDYYEQILKSRTDSEEIAKKKVSNIERAVRRWFTSTAFAANSSKVNFVQRASIIATAFVLSGESIFENACKLNDSGKAIAETLLSSMGYPNLKPTSKIEIFHIFALEKGLSYAECRDCYNSYTEYEHRHIADHKKEESHTTTFYYDYFDFETLEKDTLFEKVLDISLDLREGSKRLSEFFVKTFDAKAEESSVLETAALFYLMFSSATADGAFFSEALNQYKQHISKTGNINCVDVLSEWLFENGCRHRIIRGKRGKIKESDKTYLFDTFCTNIGDLKKSGRKSSAEYISREVFIMWLLFCETPYETLIQWVAQRFPTIQLDICFDRFAAIIANFTYSGNNILYFDPVTQTDYIVEQDNKYKWHIPNDGSVCSLRASVANVLGNYYPLEYTIDSFLSTDGYSTSPKSFEIRTPKKIRKQKEAQV